MIVLRLLMAFSTVAISALALVFLLPWLKEGFDSDELPLFSGIALGLLLLGGLHWVVERGRRALLSVGLGALAVSFLVYVALSVRIAWNEWEGERLAGTVRIVSLRETEVRLPGVAGPVGLRLDIELEHSIGRVGNLFTPKVTMGQDPQLDRQDYFYGALDRGVDAFLGAPPFEAGRPSDRLLLRQPGRIHIQYELLPSWLARREGSTICLADRPLGRGDRIPPPTGGDLGASWFFAGSGGVYVDLSPALTEALRRSSRFQGHPEEWKAMLARLQPASLSAAGYTPCPPRSSAPPATGCFCPPQGR
jgi:hypothetical protein